MECERRMTRAELNAEIHRLSAEIETTGLQLRTLPAVRYDLLKEHGLRLRELAALGKEE